MHQRAKQTCAAELRHGVPSKPGDNRQKCRRGRKSSINASPKIPLLTGTTGNNLAMPVGLPHEHQGVHADASEIIGCSNAVPDTSVHRLALASLAWRGRHKHGNKQGPTPGPYNTDVGLATTSVSGDSSGCPGKGCPGVLEKMLPSCLSAGACPAASPSPCATCTTNRGQLAWTDIKEDKAFCQQTPCKNRVLSRSTDAN